MSTILVDNFKLNTALQLDDRSVVADVTARNAIDPLRRYVGLFTYVISLAKTYQLQGGILDANWVDITGGGAVSTADTLTAHAGGGQALALVLAATLNRVTTVATAGDSVKLPAATAGAQCMVINAAAANSMNIYPVTGEAIDSLGTNAAYALTVASRNVTFVCVTAGTWISKAGGGGSSTIVYGTRASPRSIVAATGIVSGSSHMSTTETAQVIFAIGSISGESDVSANPQIQAHTVVGATMTIIGRDDSNYIKLENGTGLDLAGGDPWYSFVGNCLHLRWDGTNWYETGRRG